MEQLTFTIDGMTCESCVAKLTEAFSKIDGVDSTKIDLATKQATVSINHSIPLQQFKDSISQWSKYKITNDTTTEVAAESKLKTYKPLIILFSYILLVSLGFQLTQSFNLMQFMNHLMAGFFIGLSLFKMLDLKAFQEGFSSYDPLAQRTVKYGFIYPFIELTLGMLFLLNLLIPLASIITIIILSITTYGVVKRLRSPLKIQCACLGSGFNLPLSFVTVTENLIMIMMALINLIYL